MHRPLPHAPGVLAENRRHYELLLEMARHYAGKGEVERTLRAATAAANYAWLAPVGLLSDVRLERMAVHTVRGSGSVTVDGGRRGGRVLYVLSEAYSIGGHTRLAWRWMSRDDRPSDVVLTNQRGPVPDRLVDSVRQAGGDLHDLRSTAPGLLHRAHALRELMDRADLVVLHVHPYDAVALAAVNLPGRTGPPSSPSCSSAPRPARTGPGSARATRGGASRWGWCPIRLPTSISPTCTSNAGRLR